MNEKMKWLLAAMFVGLACTSYAHARVKVENPAILDRNARIADSVRSECNVTQLVGDGVSRRVNALDEEATQSARPEITGGEDPFLKLTILAVNGVGGGRMSGRKNMTVRADLIVQGRIAATKQFMRGTSVMGFAISGTCSLMESIAEALGKDIAKWLPDAVKAIPEALPKAPLAPSTTGSKSASAAQASITQHRKQVPFPTNFAQIDDVAAVPTSEDGRARYREYLTLPTPKTFVIYSTGEARIYSNDVDVMTQALDNCVKEGKACWLYAVDDGIVWDQNEGYRIGLSSRLRNK